MKLIIAGGRNNKLTEENLQSLDKLVISEIVSGGASGIDANGESYAYYNDIPFKRFNADWQQFGKSAGPIRNKQMAEYANAVALFNGGKGTESMFKEAQKLNLKIYDFRD